MVKDYLYVRKSPFDYFLIISLLFICYIVVYVSNGTSSSFPYLFFIPILFASYRLGFIPTIVVAMISGILLGPFMYLNVQYEIPQSTINWLIRMVFFITIAVISNVYTIRSRRLIFRDDLTHLHNRRFLEEYIHDFLPKDVKGAILFINIDKFKMINDNLGYHVGDLLLKQFAQHLKGKLRKDDLIVRWSGDEFVILMQNIDDNEIVEQEVEQIIREMKRKFTVKSNEIFISVKVGICMFPKDENEINQIINSADIALQFAKEHDIPYVFYNKKMKEKIVEETMLVEKIKCALANNEFIPYYQPKIHAESLKIAGAEALIRWRTKDNEMISPGQFIPLAEKTGLIVPIGKWMLKEACKQNIIWQNSGYPPITVSVNVSSKQFAKDDFIDDVKQTLSETKLDPQYLELEMTESTIMENKKEFIDKLIELKKIGVKLSLDDFGTGYSSLNYLRRFPIDTLKIDRSFIQNIITNHVDKKVCQAIVNMGHALGLKVVAEGVEDKRQYKILKEINCDKIQGYLFSPPMPSDEFLKFMKEKEVLTDGRG